MGLVVVAMATALTRPTALLMLYSLLLHLNRAVAATTSTTTTDTTLCNKEEYSEKTASFASDIDKVLAVLREMDSPFLPVIDENVYSPTVATAVAFGKRECKKKDDALGVSKCRSCFAEAYSRLDSHCRKNNRVGGQVSYEYCSMRYEIYDFLSS